MSASRYLLLACDVFYRECAAVAARSRHRVDLQYLGQGLHSLGSTAMQQELQQQIDAADGYDAVLLGYGLCNNALAGLRAMRVPLIVPRAHDCIALLLGDRQVYARQFAEHPGTYWLSSGWIERAESDSSDLPDQSPLSMERNSKYNEYVEKYGEDNAQYLMETLTQWTQHYTRLVFIDNGLGDGRRLRAEARRRAERAGLSFAEIPGDLRLFDTLVDGPPWPEEDFLTVPPGEAIRPSYGSDVMAV